nr:hypothetical protein CFP56_31952 [Quercus suber]
MSNETAKVPPRQIGGALAGTHLEKNNYTTMIISFNVRQVLEKTNVRRLQKRDTTGDRTKICVVLVGGVRRSIAISFLFLSFFFL